MVILNIKKKYFDYRLTDISTTVCIHFFMSDIETAAVICKERYIYSLVSSLSNYTLLEV